MQKVAKIVQSILEPLLYLIFPSANILRGHDTFDAVAF